MLSYGKLILRTKPVPVKFSARKAANEPLQKTSKVEDKVQKHKFDEHVEVVHQNSIVPRETSLVEKKEYSEVLLNVDSFDEVPGPEILRKISSVWKYLPDLGCQATVSTLLSLFKLSRLRNNVFGVRSKDRPFSKLFRKYGPVVKLQGPLGAQVVLICRPEHIAKVYEQEGKYPIRSTLDSVEKCRNQTRKSSGGPYNLNGAEWEEMRKAIEEPLTKSGEKYFSAVQDAATLFVKRIQAVLNRQNEVDDSLMLEINKWSLECLCQITLDKSLGFLHADNTIHSSETNRLLKAVIEATDAACKCESGFQLWRFMNTPSSTALAQACDVIDGILSKHVRFAQVNLSRSREENVQKSKSSFIENLLVHECMTPEEVITCILDILLIGVNTSSSALGFMLYYLAQNQRAQRRLFQEIKEILPSKSSDLEFSQMSSAPYLEACLKESLRLKMPMPILSRVLAADVVLSNFRIPKGTYVVMDAQAACLKETDFEKPDRFMPERWLEPFSAHQFAFIPFGHGLRSCVGRCIAETQIKTCVAKIIRNFQVEHNYEDIHTMDSIISFPSKPLRLTFIEREE